MYIYVYIYMYTQHTAGCCGEAHHTLVALALTQSSLVESVPSLLHGVGGDLSQGVHNVILLVSGLRILHNSKTGLVCCQLLQPCSSRLQL